MTSLTPDAVILIACAVFLGGITSTYLFERWFRNGVPTIHGTRLQLLAIRSIVWSAVIAYCMAFVLLASTLVSGIVGVAVLFGLQAILLDFTIRTRYQRIEGRPRQSATIRRTTDSLLSHKWSDRGP